MKTNSANAQGFNIAAAFAVLDEPEHEKSLLVADARRQKLPGSAAASRWSLDTLREKLNRVRRPAPFDKKASRIATPSLVASVTVDADSTSETPVAAATITVTDAPAPAPSPAEGTGTVAEAPAALTVAEAPAANAPTAPAVPAEAPAAPSAPAGPSGKVKVGARFTAKVTEKLPFGVIVQLPIKRCTALLHVSELGGGGFAARNRRLAAINVGETVQVEVVQAVKGRNRVRVSERRVDNQRLLTDLTPGAEVKAIVIQKLPFGVIATIQDGAGKNCDAMIHVSQFPGKRGMSGQPGERDAALGRMQVGTEVNAEVISVTPHQERQEDLNIKLTLRGPEARGFKSPYEAGTLHTGRVLDHKGDVFVIGLGRVKGYLLESNLGSAAVTSLKIGGNVSVRVESFDEAKGTCQLTRRGIK